MEEFKRAILASYNMSIDTTTRNECTDYCFKVGATKEGCQFCLSLLFDPKSQVEIKFFCLEVFHKLLVNQYTQLPEDERKSLKDMLFCWLTNYLVDNPEEKFEVKNKFAQVLVLLFEHEYPERWPDFFDNIFPLLGRHVTFVDMFTRIMDTIDAQITCKEVATREPNKAEHFMKIKDHMREKYIPTIVEAWHTIMCTYKDTVPDLATKALYNLKKYIGWIDLGLVCNNKFIPIFYAFLQDEALREASCQCLCEIVAKGMPANEKLSLIKSLQIHHVIQSRLTSDDPDFLETLAKLVNVIGTECLNAFQKVENEELQALASELIGYSVELVLSFLNHEDDDVSQMSLSFAHAYLSQLQKQRIGTEEQRNQQMSMFVVSLKKKMQYPPSYCFDNPDLDEAEFQNFRQELGNIFKAVMRISPQIVGEFVHMALTSSITNLQQVSFADLESSLYLFYLMGDGLLDHQITGTLDFFMQHLALIMNHNVSSYQHNAVRLVYFDIFSRYVKFLPQQAEVCSPFFDHFLLSLVDQRGLQCPNSTVRCRAAYTLLRLAKLLKTRLAQYLDQLLPKLLPSMVLNEETQRYLSYESQLYLYEVVGMLAVQNNVHTKTVMVPLVAQIEDIVANERYKTEDPNKPVFSKALLQHITAIGIFSKGLPTGTESELFKRVLVALLKAAASLPQNEELREKTLFYFRRMVPTLGEELLPYLPAAIELLINNRLSVKDLLGFLVLVNQLIGKFKESIFNVVGTFFPNLLVHLTSILSEVPRDSLPQSEEQRELHELQKQYYGLICTLVGNNLSQVLCQGGTYETVLRCLVTGCQNINSQDVWIPKQCIVILKKLIPIWGGGVVQGFDNFVSAQMLPICYSSILDERFSVSDGGCAQFVSEFGRLHQAMFAQYPEEFKVTIANLLHTSIGLSPEMINSFVQQLSSNGFANFFTGFIREIKKHRAK